MTAFEAWRAADIRHAVAFAEVAGAWRDMDRLRHADGDRPGRGDPISSAPTARTRRQVLRIAASVAAIAAVGGGVAYRAQAREMATTAVGQRKSLAAAAGVSLDLNTDSRIYWKDGVPMRLWLDRGEIAIALAADRQAQLMTPAGRFQLLPGTYNARLRGVGCELAVVEGGLSGEGDLHMRAGDTAFVNGGMVSTRSHDGDDLGRVTAWQRNTLVLNGESLDYALSEVNRYLPNKIVIGDPLLSRLRLGGTFATTDPAEFLQALRTSFNVRATRIGNGEVILTRA
nr:FecR domain-containing protein [Sphingomonas sp. MA1305]